MLWFFAFFLLSIICFEFENWKLKTEKKHARDFGLCQYEPRARFLSNEWSFILIFDK